MTRNMTYTPPTSLVTQEIREILMVNNGLTIEQFHKVKRTESIHMVADEIRCLFKRHFATVLLVSCLTNALWVDQ